MEQRELARKIDVSEVSVYNWENDRRRLSGKSIETLAKFFRISRKTLEDLKRETKEGVKETD